MSVTTCVRGLVARGGIRRRRVLDLDPLELQRLQRHVGDRARAVDAEERRRGAGALAAHHRHVGIARLRMHGEIGDGDFARARAEQRRELFVDRVEPLRAGRAAVGLRAEVERDDRRALLVGREQRAVGSKRERSDRANVGPSPVRVICTAEDGDNEARTTRANTSPSLTGRNFMTRLLSRDGQRYSRPRPRQG